MSCVFNSARSRIRLIWTAVTKALSVLKEAFAAGGPKQQMTETALALTRLDPDDRKPLDFLIAPVNQMIEEDGPYPYAYSESGRHTRTFAPEFLEWCAKKEVDPTQEARSIVEAGQADLAMLLSTWDRRTIPVLMEALEVKNYLIVAIAAMGLATFQHADAVSPIIDACQRAPADAAKNIARALAMFDNEIAIEEARRFIQDDRIVEGYQREGGKLRIRPREKTIGKVGESRGQATTF